MVVVEVLGLLVPGFRLRIASGLHTVTEVLQELDELILDLVKVVLDYDLGAGGLDDFCGAWDDAGVGGDVLCVDGVHVTPVPAGGAGGHAVVLIHDVFSIHPVHQVEVAHLVLHSRPAHTCKV